MKRPAMDDDHARWERFCATGSVADYLACKRWHGPEPDDGTWENDDADQYRRPGDT